MSAFCRFTTTVHPGTDLQSVGAALIEIVLLWASILWAIYVFWTIDRQAALLFAPLRYVGRFRDIFECRNLDAELIERVGRPIRDLPNVPPDKALLDKPRLVV